LTGEAFYPNKEITLIAEDTEIVIDPKKPKQTVWTFNGTVPGPTL
jgi:hypothetical protein